MAQTKSVADKGSGLVMVTEELDARYQASVEALCIGSFPHEGEQGQKGKKGKKA